MMRRTERKEGQINFRLRRQVCPSVRWQLSISLSICSMFGIFQMAQEVADVNVMQFQHRQDLGQSCTQREASLHVSGQHQRILRLLGTMDFMEAFDREMNASILENSTFWQRIRFFAEDSTFCRGLDFFAEGSTFLQRTRLFAEDPTFCTELDSLQCCLTLR